MRWDVSVPVSQMETLMFSAASIFQTKPLTDGARLNNTWSTQHHWSHFKPLIVRAPSTQHHRANLWQKTQLFWISPMHEEKDDHVLNNTCSACMLFGSRGLRPWWLRCLLSRTTQTNSFRRINENSGCIRQPGSKQYLQAHSFLKIKYFQGALKNTSHSIKYNNFLNILLFSPTRHNTERGYKVLLL